MSTGSKWFQEFEFDLPSALQRDLVALLDTMGCTPLNEANVKAVIPDEQGVYQLFLDDKLVYIGKTDSEAGLNQRLRRHADKIRHRRNLDPDQVTFRAVRIFVFTAIDLEQQLIKHYGKSNGLAWNNSGFGSNDPGRERDTSKLKESHFDLSFPIDIDVALAPVKRSATSSVAEALTELKSEVPYVIRFQNKGGKSRRPHPDLENAIIGLSAAQKRTARSVLKAVQNALGKDWQVTVQPGYVILYKENKLYPHASPLDNTRR